MAGQGLPWHCCGVFRKGWWCWPVFSEAAGHFLRVGRAGRVTVKQRRTSRGQAGLAGPHRDGCGLPATRACSGVSGLQSSSTGLVVLSAAPWEEKYYLNFYSICFLLYDC